VNRNFISKTKNLRLSDGKREHGKATEDRRETSCNIGKGKGRFSHVRAQRMSRRLLVGEHRQGSIPKGTTPRKKCRRGLKTMEEIPTEMLLERMGKEHRRRTEGSTLNGKAGTYSAPEWNPKKGGPTCFGVPTTVTCENRGGG